MDKIIDLRSDVKSMPTEKMREAMKQAALGDNVAGEDPTVNQLEALATEMFGKEACLFNPSGTMSNLLAIVTHAKPGEEAIIEKYSHICLSEVGGLAHVGGVMAHPLCGENGAFKEEDIIQAIRPKGLAFSRTGLICLENTHNVYGGKAVTVERMKVVYDIARSHRIPVHTDGERIFNSAVAQGVGIKELACYTDSITVGLSKGLCAPAGSLLIGPSNFIQRARKTQKMLGGAMRKPGVLAAAGLIALKEMVDRLQEDHDNAYTLAEGIGDLWGIEVDVEGVQTNIVNLDLSSFPMSPDEFLEKLKARGVLTAYHLFKPTLVRLVTYKDISQEDIVRSIEAIRAVAKGI